MKIISRIFRIILFYFLIKKILERLFFNDNFSITVISIGFSKIKFYDYVKKEEKS